MTYTYRWAGARLGIKYIRLRYRRRRLRPIVAIADPGRINHNTIILICYYYNASVHNSCRIENLHYIVYNILLCVYFVHQEISICPRNIKVRELRADAGQFTVYPCIQNNLYHR